MSMAATRLKMRFGKSSFAETFARSLVRPMGSHCGSTVKLRRLC